MSDCTHKPENISRMSRGFYKCNDCAETLCSDEIIAALRERITELEALLKARDKGWHDLCCKYHNEPHPCDCGHDAVAKYFEGVGK